MRNVSRNTRFCGAGVARVAILFCAIFATLCKPAPAPGQAPPMDDNAALQYWQAIAMMGETEDKVLDQMDAAGAEFKGDVLNFVRDGNPRLDFLRAGASMPRCNWGIDFRHGPETLVPHINPTRQLARLGLLRARYRLEQGRSREGIDDVMAAFKLSKDVGDTTLVLSLSWQYGVDDSSIDLLARHIPKMDRASLDYLAGLVEKIPADDSLPRVWASESSFSLDWTLDRLAGVERDAAGDAGKWKQGFMALPVGKFASPENASYLRQPGVPTPAKARAAIESVKALLVEMGKASGLPTVREQDAKLLELANAVQKDPVAKLFWPMQGSFFHARDRWHARHMMLDAAVAVARAGEPALKDKKYADPFGPGAPFTYRKTDGGFDLESALLFEDKPVSLVVGSAQKK